MKLYIKIILIFTLISCNKKVNYDSSNTTGYLNAVNDGNEIELEQTDDKYGEWGGDTFVVRVYRDFNTDSILIDYMEYKGSKKPPQPPPSIENDTLPWYFSKPKLLEKKGVLITKIEKKLIEESIIELVKYKLKNNTITSGYGISNSITFKDSSLIINDSPSIEWSNFQKLRTHIKGK